VRADQILGCASLAATSHARRPLVLLAAIVLVAGSFSAFLVNDTICLVMTPLVLDLVTQIDRDPIPYLLAVAMRSNVGSTATITGNPQNMITALASWGGRIRTSAFRKSIYLNYRTNLRRFRKWAIRDSLRSYERRTRRLGTKAGSGQPRRMTTAADLTATWEQAMSQATNDPTGHQPRTSEFSHSLAPKLPSTARNNARPSNPLLR